MIKTDLPGAIPQMGYTPCNDSFQIRLRIIRQGSRTKVESG